MAGKSKGKIEISNSRQDFYQLFPLPLIFPAVFRRVSLRAVVSWVGIFWIFLLFQNSEALAREYRIVLDPGHGGAPLDFPDDRWDAQSQRYLGYTNYGSVFRKYEEHQVMLALAKKVHKYLNLTKTTAGWKKFHKLLEDLGDTPQNFRRIRLASVMSRTDSWRESKFSKNNIRINDAYRLFDYPADGKNREGRISRINAQQPWLIVSFHVTSGIRTVRRIATMATVLSPGFQTLDNLRKISLRQMQAKAFTGSFWYPYWISPKKNWSHLSAAIADAWGYLNGRRTIGKELRSKRRDYRGFRQNMVSWRYREVDWVKKAKLGAPEHPQYEKNFDHFRPEGPFFTREKQNLELYRREQGPHGLGGDNFYAGMELLRFIQYGVRILKTKHAREKYAKQDQKEPLDMDDIKMNKIRKPFVSTYSLPIYTNAIVAYLEMGFTNNQRDMDLLTKDAEWVAQSIAVGIYSLFQGFQAKPLPIEKALLPKGKPIRFSIYENSSQGNYFKIVTEAVKPVVKLNEKANP